MRARPFAIALTLAACAPALGQQDPDPDLTIKWERPKYNFLRQYEDWSVMKDKPADAPKDFWDTIKYVPLSKDGKIWASFGGSVQSRVEGWSHFLLNPSSTGDDAFIMARLRMHADFHFGENVRVFIEGKSADVWGRTIGGGRSPLFTDTLALQQAFIDFRVPLDDKASFIIRPGRQMYLYGRQRLVSPLPWANTLRAWDGVTGILQFPGWRIDGFASYFVPTRKYEWNKPDRETAFYGVYARGKLPGVGSTNTDFYFLGLAKGRPQTWNGTIGNEDRYTLGTHWQGKAVDGQLDYDAEIAYQFGRVGSEDISAWMAGAVVGWTFTGTWSTPRIFGGIEYGSGDRNPGGAVNTFNQLFPLGHAYLGYIDLFSRQNIVGPNIGAQFKPWKNVTIKLEGHAFWRDSVNDDVYTVAGVFFRSGALSDASELGQEIDFTVGWQVDRHTHVLFGYSHFFAGAFFEDAPPSNDIDFVYLQLKYFF